MDSGEDRAMTASENIAKQATTSPLASALMAHEKHHSGLGDVLSELEHRLTPLLRPQEQAGEKANPGDALTAPPRSDLVAGIDDSNQRLRRYTNRIRVLLERLEI